MVSALAPIMWFTLFGVTSVESDDTPLIVAITADGQEANSQVSSRFGQTSYFVIVDARSPHTRPVLRQGPGRTGYELAYALTEGETDVVITGKIGPNALEVLQAADIQVIQGVSGTVEEALERFVAGDLK